MDYLSSLQCKTEPFASPSGVEAIVSRAARDSIEKLSHNINHGAGLQLIIGAAGSGKTTLLNQLSHKFSADNETVVLLLHNPQFRDLQQFFITVAGIFKTIKAPSGFDDDTFQKAFNNFFFKLCQQEKKTVVLLIDNGQDLPDFCLQALNSFYDHHPDCKRFLQTVICGEPSFQRKINADKALSSRVVFTAEPGPFSFEEVRKLIHFHLAGAAADPASPPALFTVPAQWVIYLLTQGHPQKTIDLCHFMALTLVIEKRKRADWFMTLRAAKLLIPKRSKKLQIIRTTSLSSLIILMLVFGLWPAQITPLSVFKQGHLYQLAVPKKMQPPEAQPVDPVKVKQKATPPGQPQETLPKVSATIKQSLPPAISSEEETAGVAPDQKYAAIPNQSKDKASTAEVSGPESTKVANEGKTESPVAATVSESPLGMEFVPKKLPADSPELVVKRVEPPDYLGDIITAPGENFGDMVRKIYGPWSFNPANVKTVLAVNPNLKNPELLNVGDKIRFPTIPVVLTPKAEEVWWIRITALDNIQSAYRFLRKYKKSSPPLVIIPSRDDSGQVLMNILLEEYFMDKESAQKAIQNLPPAITAQAEALHGLDPATFYYRVKQKDSMNDESKIR